MRIWPLTVMEGPSLALVAPHGAQPIAGMNAEVEALLHHIAVGTELRCLGTDGNIRKVVVDRIQGPLRVLLPLVDLLPDAWVEGDGALALARAERRFHRGEDPTSDLRSAMAGRAVGIESLMARLPEDARAQLLSDYARWASGCPLSADVLKLLPVARWTTAQLADAVEQVVATGAFGASSPEELLDALTARKTKDTRINRLIKKAAELVEESKKGDSHEVAWVRIEPYASEMRVVGGTKDVVYVTAIEEGARFAPKPPARVLLAYDRGGQQIARWADVAVTHVIGGYALNVDHGGRSHVSRLPDPRSGGPIELLVSYPNGIRAHDASLVWGVLSQTYGPFQMRSEIRAIGGDALVTYDPDDVTDVSWDDEHFYVVRSVEGGFLRDTIARAGGETKISGPIGSDEAYADRGANAEEKAQIITEQGAVQSFPPWRLGDWEAQDEQGHRLRRRDEQMFLALPGQPYLALRFEAKPVSVALAPPWLAIELAAGHFIAAALDDLPRARELRVGGKVILARAAEVTLPSTPAALVGLFETLVAHGLLPAMDPIARDQLLLETFEHAERPSKTTLARLLRARSPRAISHDTHWFEAPDGIIAAFDAALQGEPVRFAELEVKGDEARIEIRAPSGAEEIVVEPLIWQVADILDGYLQRHRSKRRIYAIDRYQEDIYVYVVMTPAERQALVDAGVKGIRRSAAAKV